MKKKIFNFVVVFTAILFSLSCTKDNNDDIKDFETLSFDTEAVLDLLPEGLTNSQDIYAQMTVGYIQAALNWSAFSAQLVPPGNAVQGGKKSDTYSWSWNYGGYSLTMWWTYNDDAEKKYWEIDIQYGDGPRADYLDAWENKDGSGGQVMYNYAWTCVTEEEDDDCDDYFSIYNWAKDEEENYEFEFLIDSEQSEYDYSSNQLILVDNDGSGSVDNFSQDELFQHIEWDDQGNGEWAQYSDGNETSSGNWPAAK